MAPIYDYKAYSSSGKQVRDIVEAENQKAARTKLKKLGLVVSAIEERGTAKQKSKEAMPFFTSRISSQEMTLATRQLASLIKANIPLVEALSALLDQAERPALKVVFSQVRQDVNEGLSLARAMGKHPKAFDNIFINMVESGEASGTLGPVLLKLADLKEAQMRLKGKIKSAMTYPVLMVTVSLLMVLGIFTVVIPKITKVFENSKKPLPDLTKAMIWISQHLLDYWWLVIAIIVGSVMLFLQYIRSAGGLPKWDRFCLTAPVMGPIVRMVSVTRFASTMSTLLETGVPILTAMNIAKNLVGNVHVAQAIANARENITEGQSIAEPLRRSQEFPPMVIHMIAIGEKTGELPDMLKNIAETYEEQVNSKVEGMTALIEPVMLIVMGVIVALIVFSVFMPIMDMSDIQQR